MMEVDQSLIAEIPPQRRQKLCKQVRQKQVSTVLLLYIEMYEYGSALVPASTQKRYTCSISYYTPSLTHTKLLGCYFLWCCFLEGGE